ncbi:MAG: aminotransferase class III-fold pyridoxal phosphate-dependent enzyme, partial [Rhizobiaceae bacterium]
LREKFNLIGDVRGKGLMVALELVSDRNSKAPAARDTVATVFETAYEAGVMVRISGPNLILSPPLIITSEHVQSILSAIDAGLTKAS